MPNNIGEPTQDEVFQDVVAVQKTGAKVTLDTMQASYFKLHPTKKLLKGNFQR
jgi:hypothetical protein